MQAILNNWLSGLATGQNYSPKTVESYKIDVEKFIEFITNHNGKAPDTGAFGQLTIQDFRAFLTARRKQGITQTSNARAISSLRSFYEYLGQEYGIKNEAIKLLKIRSRTQELPKALSLEQFKEIFTQIKKQKDGEWIIKRNTAIILLLYGCGLRIAEALSIDAKTWANARTQASMVITGKGNKQRVVPLLKPVINAVDDYLAVLPYEPTTHIFFGKQGRLLRPEIVQKLVRQIRYALN